MAKTYHIKKEFSLDEFKELLKKFKESVEAMSNITDIATLIEELVKTITPAHEAYLLIPKLPNSNQFQISTLSQSSIIDLSLEDSLLAECLKNKKPIIVSDISREKEYNLKTDNLSTVSIQKILIIPLLKDEIVISIVWAGISQKNINHFTEKDIEYITQFFIPDTILQAYFTQNIQKEKIQEELQKVVQNTQQETLKSIEKEEPQEIQGEEEIEQITQFIDNPIEVIAKQKEEKSENTEENIEEIIKNTKEQKYQDVLFENEQSSQNKTQEQIKEQEQQKQEELRETMLDKIKSWFF